MNAKKTGLVLGSFLGLWHLAWSVLISMGWAQGLLDFIYNMHSLNNPFVVMPFNLIRSVGLVIVTFIVGYLLGNVLAMLWNKFQR